MFNDFLNINYWKTKNKLKLLRDLINRISIPEINEKITSLDQSINRFDNIVQNYRSNHPRLPTPGYDNGGFDEEEEPIITEDLPDLVVTSILTEMHDNYVNFKITVKNQGLAPSASNTLNVVIPNISNVDLTVPDLEIGETVVLNHQYSFDPESEEELEKTIIATADAYNTVPERNEDNNTRSISATVKHPLQPPVGRGYLIVHIHNPEGKEIGSITNGANIYLNYGIIPINESTHGIPTEKAFGTYNIIAIFNGMTLHQEVILEAEDEEGHGNTAEIFFVFERVQAPLSFDVSENRDDNVNWVSADGSYELEEWQEDAIPWDLYYHFKLAHHIGYPAIYDAWANWQSIIDVNITDKSFYYNNFFHIEGAKNNPLSQYINYTLESRIYSYFPPQTPLSINLSPQTSFTRWYCQNQTTNKYPYIYIDDGNILNQKELIRGNRLDDGNSPWWLFNFGAGINWTRLTFHYADYWTPDLLWIGTGSFPGQITSTTPISRTYQVIGGGSVDFVISSVPYDMEGTAV